MLMHLLQTSLARVFFLDDIDTYFLHELLAQYVAATAGIVNTYHRDPGR